MHYGTKAIIVALLFCFVSCDRDYELVSSIKTYAIPDKHNDDTIIRRETGKGYFSRLRKSDTRGLFSAYIIPDSIKDQEFKVVFSGRIRTNYAYSNAIIIVGTFTKERVANIWDPVNLRYYVTDIDQWCNFKDSMTFTREAWQDPNYYVNVFAYLGNSQKENYDMDTLEVNIYTRKKN